MKNILYVLMLLLVLQACKKDDETTSEPNPCERIYTVDSVSAKVELNNTLRYKVFFGTSELVDAYVDYWPTGEEKKERSRLSANEDEHAILLINMTAETEYEYEIVSIAGDCTFTSEVYTFTTGELPIELPEINLNNVGLEFDGYILGHTYLSGTLFAMNHQGKIVWYEIFSSPVLVSTITPRLGHITLLGSKDYVEKDFFGEELRLFAYLSSFNYNIHHEIFVNDNNEAVTLVTHSESFDLSSVGGSISDEVYSDGIVTFAPDGTETWQWDVFDVVDPTTDPNVFSTKNDWTHCNAVAYDTDGNLLLSLRNFNQIWKINRQDGSLMWKLGLNGDFAMDTDDYFYKQHAVTLNPEGKLMLYDNGQSGIERTRALVFDIDETNMTASTSLKVELPPDFFSPRQSNCMMVDSDKVMFANSEQNAVIITDLSGNFLWHVDYEKFYRAYYFEKFY